MYAVIFVQILFLCTILWINGRKRGKAILILPETAKKGMIFLLDRTSLVITIVGALNWLLVGIFRFDLVAYLCGGPESLLSRIIYTVVGIAGLWCISLLFRQRVPARDPE